MNINEFDSLINIIKPNRRIYAEDKYLVYYAEENIFDGLNIEIIDFSFFAQIRSEEKIFDVSILPKRIVYGFTNQYDDCQWSNLEEYETTDLNEFLSVLLSNQL